MTVLGSPQEYRAIIHWRGGSRPFVSPSVDALTELSWSRTVNDISEAQVTIAKAGAAECCAQLGQVEPWVHELSLYRDLDLVWQGPIARQPRETRSSFVLEAQDVLGWLARCQNTWLLRYVTDTPDAAGRRRGPVQWIAEHIVEANLTSPFSDPPDYPNLLQHIVREDGPAARFEKDGSSNAAVWSARVLDILHELALRGLEFTTSGRSLLLRFSKRESDRAQARLTLDHIIGDIEVIKDGSAAATYAWATSQRSHDISDGATAGTGEIGTPYGRLDWLVASATDAGEAELEQMAREALRGRYPAPLVVSVPTGSRLAPTAPLSIQQLVAGERLDLTTEGFCMQTTAAFTLSDVEVGWGASGEEVAVTLVPTAALPEGI
jgi:hypothetical protein